MPLTEKMVRLAAPEIPVGDEQGPETVPGVGEQSVEDEQEEGLGGVEAGLEMLKEEATHLFDTFEAAPRGKEDLESILKGLEDLKDTAEKCSRTVMEYQGNFTEAPPEEGVTASLKKKAEDPGGEKEEYLGDIEMALDELTSSASEAWELFEKPGKEKGKTWEVSDGDIKEIQKLVQDAKESADMALETLERYIGLYIPVAKEVGPGEPGHGPAERMGPPSSASKKD